MKKFNVWLCVLLFSFACSNQVGLEYASVKVPTPAEIGVDFNIIETQLPPVEIAVTRAVGYLTHTEWGALTIRDGKNVYLSFLMDDQNLNERILQASYGELAHFLAQVCGRFTATKQWSCQVKIPDKDVPFISSVLIKPLRAPKDRE
jgi:hypothetical protein